jgi:hypothetical protein
MPLRAESRASAPSARRSKGDGVVNLEMSVEVVVSDMILSW